MSAADAQIGRNLRMVRRSRGLTQAALGSRLNPPLTGSAVGHWERASKRIAAGQLVAAAKVLNFPVIQFFDGVE